MRAPRHFVREQTGRFVDYRREFVSRPSFVGTSLEALEPMDGSMAFHDALRIKPCFLKLPVNVARKYEGTVFHCRRPSQKDAEAGMGHGCAIKREAVPIESPAQARVRRKAGRVGNVLEGESMMAQRRIRMPETLLSTEIRQS
jgi:hypothetical protein